VLSNFLARTKSENAHHNLVACIHLSVAFSKSEDYKIIKSYSCLIFYTGEKLRCPLCETEGAYEHFNLREMK
jgi:hypothetical protein